MKAIIRCTINCFGASEAQVAARIEDLTAPGREPTVTIAADQAIIRVGIMARGDDSRSARTIVEAQAKEIRDRLGKLVFGQDEQTLSEAVAGLLVQSGNTVATAESCTGGLLAKRLTDVPGSSAYFYAGFVTYADQAKVSLLQVPETLIERFGAVSQEVAASMAQGCHRTTGAAFGLSVTGIAGPGGGSVEKPIGLVYIGLADADGCQVQRCQLGEHFDRRTIRDRSCKVALNVLRLRLMEKAVADRP